MWRLIEMKTEMLHIQWSLKMPFLFYDPQARMKSLAVVRLFPIKVWFTNLLTLGSWCMNGDISLNPKVKENNPVKTIQLLLQVLHSLKTDEQCFNYFVENVQHVCFSFNWQVHNKCYHLFFCAYLTPIKPFLPVPLVHHSFRGQPPDDPGFRVSCSWTV